MTHKEGMLPEVGNFIQTRWETSRIRYSPESISLEMRNITERLAKLTGKWNPVEIYTPNPSNLMAEKARFLQAQENNDEYNPTFEYDIAENMNVTDAFQQLREMLKEVRSFEPKNDQERLFRIALYAKVRDDIATCYLVDGIKNKDEAMIKLGMSKYPGTDPILIAYAKQAYKDLLSSPSEPLAVAGEPLLNHDQQELLRKNTLNAEEIKEAFEWVLDKYGILRNENNPSGFQVVISDRATAIDVRDKSDVPMTIYIPTTRVVTGDKLLELVAHEIEGHARQSVNGSKLFGIAGGALKLDDETLYEGLATRMDESFHKRFYCIVKGIPGPLDVFAVKKAEKGATFQEIFQDQYERRLRIALRVPEDRELTPDKNTHAKEISEAKNLAWTMTYRVMRGHSDMTNPLGYAMSKDLGYLRGWLSDKQLRDAGYGGMNEMGIIQTGGLQLMARLALSDSDIPHPYQDFTKEYCFIVLIPKLMATGIQQ